MIIQLEIDSEIIVTLLLLLLLNLLGLLGLFPILLPFCVGVSTAHYTFVWWEN